MWLKRSTPQNIVIGGAAGAFPPVIAWACATGSVSAVAVMMFLIIFFWTPPHFWALTLYRGDDYERAGVPMLPVVEGTKKTRAWILFYSFLLAPLALAPSLAGFAGPAYTVTATAMGALFLLLALRVYRTSDDEAVKGPARRLFAYSILYLFALFAVLLVDAGPHGGMFGG